MRRHRHSLLLLPFCLLTTGAACSGERPSSAVVTVRDSAGITIVENSVPLWPDGHGWRLSDSPILQIGALEASPEYQFFRAVDAIRLADGRIVVANAGSDELRFYDTTGRYLGSTGREGGGPGEFNMMARLDRYGADSMFTWDWGNTRVSVFDAAGAFARSFKLEMPSQGSSYQQPRGSFPDGSLLAEAGRLVFGSSEVVSRDSTLLVHHSAEGAVIDTIGRFPGPEYWVRRSGRGLTILYRPFGRVPQLVTWGDGFYYGSSDSFQLGYYSVGGLLQRLVRKDQPDRPVTAQDIEDYKQEQLESAGSEGYRTQLRDMFSDLPFPETMPAYSTFKVDSEGNLWVEDYRRPGDERPRWSAFDPEGRWLGMVETPQRFSVEQIGPDFVLGFFRDEMDVEYVYLYQLIKEPGDR